MFIAKKRCYQFFCAFIVCVTVLSIASNCFAGSGEFELNCPYWYMLFDRAGYLDITYWYPSERHEYGPHEMMTGDWAAAVWYQNIPTGSQAAWLTNSFVVPSFSTQQNFDFSQPSSSAYYIEDLFCNPVWLDLNNPVPSYNPATKADTGWSEVNDVANGGKLQVKIHYEVVDLGQQDTNGVGGSPISFRDANGTPVFVYSERFVLLQTYVFKNISAASLTGLEFYQMLHGHPANAYSGLTGCYETANFYDPLQNYIPYDSNHQMGNFKYDITQWNSGDPETEHVDWLSFSSTIEPVVVDFNEFAGSSSAMRDDIENRDLNGRIYWENDDMAGAAKWNLGDLSSGQTKSITLALMYGIGPIQTTPPTPPLDANLSIADDVNDGDCVNPSFSFIDSFINYNICYTAGEDINDANIIAILPEYAEFNSCTGGGIYDSGMHQVVWDLGNLDANDSNCFTLKLKVPDYAPQGETLTTTVKLYSGEILIKTETETTLICCVDDVVYVDKNATGVNNGSNWDNAYPELRDALAAINAGSHGCANQIWVANGIYKPTNDANLYNETFQMLDGIDVYGHFGGIGSYETMLCQRNLADTNNKTILTGDIDDNNTADVYYVVRTANMTLDGFTVKKGRNSNGGYYSAAIYCYDTNSIITNCTIKENDSYGIRCENADGTLIKNCVIKNNNTYYPGIYCWNADITVESCTIGPINGGGLLCKYSKANISDCLYTSNNGYGIYALDSSELFITGSSILNNSSYGIAAYTSGDDSDISITDSIVANNTNTGIAGIADVIVERCKIYGNSYYGIVELAQTIKITDNLIYCNTIGGILRSSNSASAVICNNTLYNNDYYGINLYSGTQTAISNNIVWGSTASNITSGFSNITYNCVEGGYTGTGNRSDNPEFRNADANDFHLIADSNCINAGDPNFTPDAGETDIDGENRIMLNYVDMGADEFYHSTADLDADGYVDLLDFSALAADWQSGTGISDFAILAEDWLWLAGWNLEPDIGGGGAYFAEAECPLEKMGADFNNDGFVNFADFALLAKTWEKSSGQTDYNYLCDLYNDSKIDYKDLDIFCENWLWRAD